jgi:hypothetical protein
MDLGLDGDSALVTAGTAGLGLASAEALADCGVDVAVCGRTEERLESARETLEATGDGDVLCVQADITERSAVESFVDETVDAFGGLDHVDERLHRARFGDVRLHAQYVSVAGRFERLPRRFQSFLCAAAHRDVRAAVGQRLRRRQAEAGRPRRHQRAVAFESEVHTVRVGRRSQIAPVDPRSY